VTMLVSGILFVFQPMSNEEDLVCFRVCVCVCLCVCVCEHIFIAHITYMTRARAHTHTHTHYIHGHTHTRMHARARVHTHMGCVQVIRSTVAITFILSIDELLYGACSSARRKSTFKRREFKIPARKALYKVLFVFVSLRIFRVALFFARSNSIFEERDRYIRAGYGNEQWFLCADMYESLTPAKCS